MPYSEINRVEFGNSLVLKALVFCFPFRFREERMAELTPGDTRVLEHEWSIFFRVIIVVFFGGVLGPSTPLSSLGSGD